MPVAVAKVLERQTDLVPLAIVPDQPVDNVTPAQLEQARASARMLGIVLLCGVGCWLTAGVVVLDRLIG